MLLLLTLLLISSLWEQEQERVSGAVPVPVRGKKVSGICYAPTATCCPYKDERDEDTMIEPSVLEVATQFAKKWDEKLQSQSTSLLLLDGTWPSVGVLDLITYELRGKTKLESEDRSLLQGAAAYLSKIAHDCWSAFGAQVEVSSQDRGIELRAISGPKLAPGENFQVFLEQDLEKCLCVHISPFPVLADFSRPVSFDANLLSLFGIGLMSGLPPFGEGPWLLESPDSFQENIEPTVKVLARGCADYYSRVYPNETLGQVAELYLHRLIYPPSMMDGELPACKAVKGLLEFCKKYSVGQQGLLLLSHNLALSPDDLLSQVGLAMYAALIDGGQTEGKLSAKVVAAAQIKGNLMGLLRPAMLLARHLLELRGDWILEDRFSDTDVYRFSLETELGFLPWVKLPLKRVKEKRLAPLLFALSTFDFERAKELVEDLLEKTPGDVDLGIQRAELEMVQGDFEKAGHFLGVLYTEPEAENNPVLLDQWAMCHLAQCNHDRGKLDEALKYLEMAYGRSQMNSSWMSRIANNYGSALILKERYREAIEVLEVSLKMNESFVTALLNKAYAERMLGQEEGAEAILKQLKGIAPFDRRVIANLLRKN